MILRTYVQRLGHWSAVAVKYLILCSYLIVTILPLWWSFSNSFRTNDQIFTTMRLFPESFQLANYLELFAVTNMPRAFYNSLSITVVTLVGLLVCVAPLCFVLSRYKFRFAGGLYFYFVIALFIPSITVIGSTFQVYKFFGFVGMKYPIVLVNVAHLLPLSILLIISYMQSIPSSLDESAIIDGCGPWQLFTRIIMPLAQNGLVTVLILAFVNTWNDYIYPFLLLPKEHHKTLTVALAAVKTEHAVSYGMVSAAVIFAVVPMMTFYLILKERLISGMVSGAVKG